MSILISGASSQVARRAISAAWLSAGVLCLAAVAAPAAADVIVTWNTCAGDGALKDCDIDAADPLPDLALAQSLRVHSDPAGINNNYFTFSETVEGQDRPLVARAFRTDSEAGGATATAILPAEIKIFEGGLGVHWKVDGGPSEKTSAPDHALDNIGYDELIQLQFADPLYKPVSFRIGWNCDFGSDGDSACEFGGGSDILAFMGSGDINAAFLQYLQTGTVLAGFTAELFEDVGLGSEQIFESGGTGEFLIIAAAPGTHGETSTQKNQEPGVDIPEDFDNTADARAAYCGETYASTDTNVTRSNFRSRKVSNATADKTWTCRWDQATTVAHDGTTAFKLLQITGVLLPPPPPPQPQDLPVPEPGTFGLLGFGIAGLVFVGRRRRDR